eukprot:138471_1
MFLMGKILSQEILKEQGSVANNSTNPNPNAENNASIERPLHTFELFRKSKNIEELTDEELIDVYQKQNVKKQYTHYMKQFEGIEYTHYMKQLPKYEYYINIYHIYIVNGY